MLATTIAKLRADASEADSALVYVSNHGESLGELGLFLHGLPHAMAPAQQTQVPMLMWFRPGFERAAGFDADCLRPSLQRMAAQPLAHDHLFHTLLGLLDVRTQVLEPAWDLTRGCRGKSLATG